MQNHRDRTHKILLIIFARLAEQERGFVSERTKEGLRSRREQGIALGKLKGEGEVQPSMCDIFSGIYAYFFTYVRT